MNFHASMRIFPFSAKAELPEGVQKRGHVQVRSDLIFLEKPFEMDTLLTLIQQILEENERKPFFFPSNLQIFSERSLTGSGFVQESLSQRTGLRAMFHFWRPNPSTSEGIYHLLQRLVPIGN
ncbi:MAG: hypothetical protein J2P36_20975 [Ktedonobacteraceae bacterium]|nr:hypothetical protein [Ktedonobacteraceae bacterium]